MTSGDLERRRHEVASRLSYAPAFQGTLQPWFTKSAEEPGCFGEVWPAWVGFKAPGAAP